MPLDRALARPMPARRRELVASAIAARSGRPPGPRPSMPVQVPRGIAPVSARVVWIHPEVALIPKLKQSEVWFVTGCQHLYGPETLAQVAENSQKIAAALDCSSRVPCRVVFKPVVKTPDEIPALLTEANVAKDCVGLILWMHTFSPAKMWIGGLAALQKPFLHLHTQFNRDLPWGDDRHGLHEPEPGRPRRPRVRVHLHAPAPEPQGRRRALAGRRGARRGRRRGCARPAAGRRRGGSRSPASATTCARSRSPRATRSRRSASSATRSTATASATSSRSSAR